MVLQRNSSQTRAPNSSRKCWPTPPIKLLGVQRLITTPYHPQSNNSLEERAHHTLSALLTLLREEHGVDQADWPELLPLALFTMRTTVHRMTGYSPMRLVFGYQAALPEMLHTAPAMSQHVREGRVDMAQHIAVDGDGVVLNDAQRRQRLVQAKQLAQFRAADVQRVWQRLFDVAVVEERRRLGDPRLDGADDVARGPLAHIKEGDYVRVFDADVLMRDQHALNPKLEARRWSPPYRVFQVLRGAALILTLATDPLKNRNESGLRVKRIELPDELREQYDRLFAQTQLDKARMRRERRQLLEKCGWHYKDDESDDNGVLAEEILCTRGQRRNREARVRWNNGTVTWANYEAVRQLAPEVCTRYRATERRRKTGEEE